MTRQALEAVLRKHGVIGQLVNYHGQTFEKDTLEAMFGFDTKALLSDLLALWTPPSREALEKMLREEFTIYSNQHDCPTPSDCLCAITSEREQKLVADRIMAWVQGHKTWCIHQDGKNMPPPNVWDICPVQGCHAPRPT